MILNGFKQKNIQRHLEKELVKTTSSQTEISKTKIVSVLIFIDKKNDAKIVKVIAKVLSLDLSNIHLVVFKTKIDVIAISENDISENDFNLFGKVKSEQLKKIMEQSFDLLLNYTTDNLYLNYLTVLSKASFKVGYANSDARLYNFMIAVNDTDETVFNSELKKYLKILNKI